MSSWRPEYTNSYNDYTAAQQAPYPGPQQPPHPGLSNQVPMRMAPNGPAPASGLKPSLDEITDSLKLGVEQREIWDEIHKLGLSGVDNYIDLPQIVVVGDQSAGKSSVLEAITGLTFPRAQNMCTKFPTQINLKKRDQRYRSVDLKPARASTVDRDARMRFVTAMRGEEDIETITRTAEATIWPHGNSGLASKDTLIIEIGGPQKQDLTIVDLPGIIQSATGIQTKADIEAIKDLALDYMKSPRTIIMAVISAGSDYSNQPILDMAKAIDPNGLRTLGIITKPDRIEGSPAAFISLAKNETVGAQFALGWHVLKNRSEAERNVSHEERNRIEREYLSSTMWSELHSEHRGIDALVSRLSTLLLQRFMSIIPSVKQDIYKGLNDCDKRLADLGEGYGTPGEMRKRMDKWCETSRDYIRAAHEGYSYRDNYGAPFFNKNSQIRRLRARLDEENRRFERDLRALGHTIEIIDDDNESPIRAAHKNHSGNLELKSMKRKDFIRKKIIPEFTKSSGKEMPTFSNPLLIYEFFKEQSKNWPFIAKGYMKEVLDICDTFLDEVLSAFWPKALRADILALFAEEDMAIRRSGAEAELEKICEDAERYAKSYDQDFLDRLNYWSIRFSQNDHNDPETASHILTEGEKCLAAMRAHYEVTFRVFLSNVIIQVSERHLIDKLEGVFESKKMNDIPDAKIEDISKEPQAIVRERAELKAKKVALEAGWKSIKKLAASQDFKIDDTYTRREQPEYEDPPITTPSSRRTSTPQRLSATSSTHQRVGSTSRAKTPSPIIPEDSEDELYSATDPKAPSRPPKISPTTSNGQRASRESEAPVMPPRTSAYAGVGSGQKEVVDPRGGVVFTQQTPISPVENQTRPLPRQQPPPIPTGAFAQGNPFSRK